MKKKDKSLKGCHKKLDKTSKSCCDKIKDEELAKQSGISNEDVKDEINDEDYDNSLDEK